MIFGTFDLFHPGHEFVLNEAMKRGQVTVIVARDKNVEKIKGRLPEQTEEVRVRTIREQFPEVTAVLGDARDFLSPVRETKPDLILLGYDQKLPPGVEEKDLPCPMERLPAFEPEKNKTSTLRGNRG